MKLLMITAFLASSLSNLALADTRAPRGTLISCRLQNNTSYAISRTAAGQYQLSFGGLRPDTSPSQRKFLTDLGVSEDQIPRGSVSGELTLPAGACLFPANPSTPQFTCEWSDRSKAVALTLRDFSDKPFATVSLGSILVEQHTSVVNALRKVNGRTTSVAWKHNPVLFYFKNPGKDGGPSLGSTFRNEGFTSDDAGHGACVANFR